jgi:hypothetical protein
MPRSRGRQRRHESSRQRQRRREHAAAAAREPTTDGCHDHDDRVCIATLRPGQDLTHLLTDDDRAHMEACIDASARGEAMTAFEHHEAGLQVEGTLTRYQLRELALLGDDAPGWMFSRWCIDQAYRWMLHEQDPRTDQAVRQTMVIAHWEAVAALPEDDPVALTELGTRIAGGDWLCQQLAVFEYGGLLDFLDVKAEASLLDRADRVREWSDARMGGYVLEEQRRGVLAIRDLANDVVTEVLNLGALTDALWEGAVVGRLVPISVSPGLMFESRPVSVDMETARDVAQAMRDGDRDAWIPEVGEGRHSDRLPYGFSCGGQTLYSSDIVPEQLDKDGVEHDPPGRLVELLEAGLDELQANGVMVAEVAFIAMDVSGRAAADRLAPHIAAVIFEPRVFEAIRQHGASAEHVEHWQWLAEASTPPARGRCHELARLSRL